MGISVADVASIPVFSKLRLEAIGLIQQVVVERIFRPGRMIFLEGERSRGLWFLKEGRIKIFRMSADGREQGLCLMRAGMCCGCPLFYGEMNPASAQAMDTVTLYFIEREVALGLAAQYPDFGRALFGVFARGEKILSSLVVSLSCSRLIGRLAQILLEHAERQEPVTPEGSWLALSLSHQELACLVGTSREVITRCLERLERTGAIELARKRITVLDSEKLRAQTR